MNVRPLSRWLALASAALSLSASGAAFGQSAFPNRAVTLILGFAPGGGSDIVARTVQPKLTELLGQPVLIENRTGASGVIAAAAVAKAAPDGHTLHLSWDTHAINPVVTKTLPYDTFKDFAGITETASSRIIDVRDS